MIGWGIGYLVAHPEICKIVAQTHKHLNMNTCTFIQKGSCAVFSLPKNYLDDYKNILKDKLAYLNDCLMKINTIRMVEPQAGLFSFLNILRTGLTADEFSSQFLLKYHVATHPGDFFGTHWNDHIRISLTAELHDFKMAIQKLVQYASSLRAI